MFPLQLTFEHKVKVLFGLTFMLVDLKSYMLHQNGIALQLKIHAAPALVIPMLVVRIPLVSSLATATLDSVVMVSTVMVRQSVKLSCARTGEFSHHVAEELIIMTQLWFAHQG